MKGRWLVVLLLLTACSTTEGPIGVASRFSNEPGLVLKAGAGVVGTVVKGSACHYFVLGLIPWGGADLQAALDDALSKSAGADALINVTAQHDHFTCCFIYNIYTSTCTRVQGTAIKYEITKETAPVAIAAIGQSDQANPNLLEKEFQKLIQQLFVGLANQKTLKLAVLPTEHISGAGSKTLSSYMTEKLTFGVYDAKVGRLVERARLSRILDELELSHAPTFNEDTAKRIGRMSGADIVIISSYAEIGTKIMEINAKAVSVETGEIVGVGTARLQAEMVNRLIY